MPVLKHAKKKLRQDKQRTLRNKSVRTSYKGLIKNVKLKPTAAAVSLAFKQIDKAAKQNIIHKNKAARLKSSLSKLVKGHAPKKEKASTAPVAKTKKTTTKTKSSKASTKKSSAQAN